MTIHTRGTAGAQLSLRGLTKHFDATAAVDGIDLEVRSGEFVTFLGPSGSGKTTTLNMIAGFVTPSAGRILLDGRDVSAIPAYKRGIGVVFQHYALFPHMSVADNVAYPLKQRRIRGAERDRLVAAALDGVELGALASRRPAQLSGGQQQRVALARALAFQPPLLLLDEPLGALDRRLRETLQLEIKRLHQELGITFIYVTHDQDEALLLSDRIAIFHEGTIAQIDTARGLYERPSSRFVAEFVGDSNIFEGVLDRSGTVVEASSGVAVRVADCSPGPLRQASVVVRPEHVTVGRLNGHQPSNTLRGRVVAVHYMGSAYKVEVALGPEGGLVAWVPAGLLADVRPGDEVEVGWHAEDCVTLLGDASSGRMPQADATSAPAVKNRPLPAKSTEGHGEGSTGR